MTPTTTHTLCSSSQCRSGFVGRIEMGCGAIGMVGMPTKSSHNGSCGRWE